MGKHDGDWNMMTGGSSQASSGKVGVAGPPPPAPPPVQCGAGTVWSPVLFTCIDLAPGARRQPTLPGRRGRFDRAKLARGSLNGPYGHVGLGFDVPGSCPDNWSWDITSFSCVPFDQNKVPLPGSCPNGTSWVAAVDTGSVAMCVPDIECAYGMTWSPDQDTCIPICEQGFTYDGPNGCIATACPEGQGRLPAWAGGSPSDFCIPCDYGQDTDGSCFPCPAGAAYTNTGECVGANIIECPQGTGRGKLTGDCIVCDWGTDADGTCQICPTGSTYTTYNDGSDGCVCNGNTQWSDPAGKCVPIASVIVTPPPIDKPPPPTDKQPPVDEKGPPPAPPKADSGGGVFTFLVAAIVAAAAAVGIAKVAKKNKRS